MASSPTSGTRTSPGRSVRRSPSSCRRDSGATAVVTAHDMRESSVPLSRAFAEGVISRGRRRRRGRARAPPTCCTSPPARSTCPARCSPPATTRRSTTASRCAGPGPPRSARTPGLATIREWAERGQLRPRARAGRHGHPAGRARRVRRPPALAGRPLRHPPAAGRRRRRQRHGRAHRPGRARRAAAGRSSRCTSSSTAPSPTTRPTRWTRPTWSTCRPPSGEHGADIGLAFDGDADRVFVVDERGDAGQPVGDHRAGRRPRAGQGPRDDDHPQPDHLAGGARDRPRARRRAGAHPGRALVHQGRDGPHRRRLRRRALRALLLPRLLARRHRHARRHARARGAGRAVPAAVGADRRLQPLRRVRRDQLHGRRRAGRDGRGARRPTPSRTASPSTSSTG